MQNWKTNLGIRKSMHEKRWISSIADTISVSSISARVVVCSLFPFLMEQSSRRHGPLLWVHVKNVEEPAFGRRTDAEREREMKRECQWQPAIYPAVSLLAMYKQRRWPKTGLVEQHAAENKVPKVVDLHAIEDEGFHSSELPYLDTRPDRWRSHIKISTLQINGM